MKRIFLLLLPFVLFAGNPTPQRFKVTYTITYNTITLSQADSLEQLLKSKFKDACSININLDNASPVLCYHYDNADSSFIIDMNGIIEQSKPYEPNMYIVHPGDPHYRQIQ